ncbi:MAG: hypothetical protein PVI63_03990 [Anaerolineae bacterium]|jgi:hypothetical protein
MTRQSAVTVTVVVSLLTIVLATLCSATGVCALADQGCTIDVHPAAGIPLIGLGLLLWSMPPLLWVARTRGRGDRFHNS